MSNVIKTPLLCHVISQEASSGAYKPSLTVDCANGIGAIEIKSIEERIRPVLKLNLINEGSGRLNHNVRNSFSKQY